MRTYVADINTGIRYQNEELFKNMNDWKVAYWIHNDMLLQHEGSEVETKIFKKVLTPELMVETLQTNNVIDGRYFLKDIDREKFQARLPEKEAKTLQKYLPVLMGGEFTWIERSFASHNEPHEPKQVVIQDIIDRVEPQEIMVDSISFADVFQSGTQDVILYFPIIGGHYLILHEEEGVIYGIDYPVRWFQDLQEDGLYCSSGSAFFQRYFKMTFSDGDFAEHHIATIDEDVFYIGDEKQGVTDEESWELYLIWREENTQNPVKRYYPFS